MNRNKIRAAMDWCWHGICQITKSSQLQQLENSLPDFEKGLEVLKAKNKAPSSPEWAVAAADAQLVKVKEAVDARDTELAWRCFKSADRFTLYLLKPEPLETRASMVLNESAGDGKDLPKWRQDTIKKLLTDKNGDLKTCAKVKPGQGKELPPDDVVDAKRIEDKPGQGKELTSDDVVDAKRILDEHQDNVYRRLSLLKSRLMLLSFFGIAFLVVWLFVFVPPVPSGLVASGENAALTNLFVNAATFWRMVVLAGVLGGLISAFTSAIGDNFKKSNIPSELSTGAFTFARLVVAALSALAVTLFLTSGILNVDQLKLSYGLVIAVAIVSGFTDRLLLSAIETLANPGK